MEGWDVAGGGRRRTGTRTRVSLSTFRVVDQLDAGTCWINEYNLSPPELPFGETQPIPSSLALPCLFSPRLSSFIHVSCWLRLTCTEQGEGKSPGSARRAEWRLSPTTHKSR
eukprot:766188-Hanusia_phi.AAC.4